MPLLLKEKSKLDEESAIVVNNVSKCYRIPMEKKRTVYENIIGMFSGNKSYEEFWALKDVSFNIKRGETFGVIGPNGSGKSTLLKMLAGVLYPDSGSVKVNGRIAPFLELGVGFQYELTAKENIYLYGAIMGLTKKEVDRKYEDILDFAELKRFENMKLRNFSSGMYVRLAFSIAIQTDPDILLLDEVLAVGDEHFQKKCMEKIEDIRKSGKTIVFVSHSLPSVNSLCQKSLLLNSGMIVAMGETNKVIQKYQQMANQI
ncbi:ABC transporter ATP binding protein [Methanocella paludicola SANAE]|uniref:ABC transporter ATP binding protein n=1 Tax=Methanocella paludicola (strain DSM 17711 / JCM 13418 / NBRC 101707 / SANAE) TaxID=304371 RepID=D1YV45_METPS|nr:ABC transporter ATP-binding protein [Methanocella paludicola]BAI60317.1 ABC transporter ATP binding protein [Methanocella paludicola SANAE]